MSLVNFISVEASVKKPADAICTHTNTHKSVCARTHRILSAFTHTTHTQTPTHTHKHTQVRGLGAVKEIKKGEALVRCS